MQAPHAVSLSDIDLLDELGRGVHSVVYRARRQSRYYAVKMPLFGGDDHLETVAKSFLREATALARVRHPALPAVMEVGWSKELPYLVMELVAGETLAARLRRGVLNELEVVDLGVQLADALHSIHKCGLVHHDVSTANILFDAHTDAVRLIDFGFAQTTPLSVVVAPSSDPHAEVAGPAIDLLALGRVLFECVTALSPFVGVDPRPLLERGGDHHDLQPHISRPLADILRRLMRLDTVPGYDDAARLLRDLRSLGQSSAAQRFEVSQRLRLSTAVSVAMVGRERELDRLRLAWRTSGTRQGQVVLVRGCSGSGKTRLIQAFVDELAGGRDACFVFKCQQGQHEPFVWVRRLIHGYLARFDALSSARKEEALHGFRQLAGDAAPLLRVLSARLGRIFASAASEPRGDGAEEIFAEGLAEFLLKLLNESALATVVIDDVQWLDPGSRSVLTRLCDRDGTRALIILGARDDADSWSEVGRLTRTFNPERVWELALEPLDDARVAELIDAYLGRQPYDLELLRFVITVSDHTPLSVLEVLRVVLEHGALVPNWGRWRFDMVRAAGLGVPRGGLELLARRLEALRPNTLEMLLTAAVQGSTFDVPLLCDAMAAPEPEVNAMLAEACGATLVESVAGEYGFVHDSVREVLLSRIDSVKRRELHQRVGDALRRTLDGPPGAAAIGATPPGSMPALKGGLIYAVAAHHAAGLRDQYPRRVLDSCVAAGRLAFQTFDNELALRYFREAERAAAQLSVVLPLEVRLEIAEAHLRTGDVETSLAIFSEIVEASDDAFTRARTLSRIAFIHAHHNRKEAWEAFEQAFETLGARPPSGGFWALLVAVCWWLRWMLGRCRPPMDPTERTRLEVLSQLYYQVIRLAVNEGKLGCVLEVTLRSLVPAERLGSSGELCNAYLMYSFALTSLGARGRGRVYLDRTEAIARATNDPSIYAHMLQVHVVVLAWAGDIIGAVHAASRSLTEYGRWRELSEFCLTIYNLQQIEGLRGRCRDAWKWVELAVSRLKQQNEGPGVTIEYIEDIVRAALMAQGREREADALLSRLRETKRVGVPRAIAGVASYGADVRLFTECGRLDEGFEALVAEIEAKRFDPKRVHLEMTEYYVHVAHARVHALLRASEGQKARNLANLRRALSDLKKSARIPLIEAHALVVDGFRAYFEGDLAGASRLLARAEQLGQQQAAPWVLYSVHRARAHMARSRGELEAAHDQARLAEAMAKEHRAVYRLRWIREEFQLRAATRSGLDGSPASSSSEASDVDLSNERLRPRSRAYLRSLVRIDQQTDLTREHQAKAVIDELVESLSADRGFLFLAHSWPELGDSDPVAGPGKASLRVVGLPSEAGIEHRLDLVAARSVRGVDVDDTNYDTALVEDLFSLGESYDTEYGELGAASTVFFEGRAVLAAPIVMRRQRIGVVYLDRPRRLWPFSTQDRDTLLALADQVPLVFELGRTLRARGRAEQTQRSAEKLEAIGRLAGGIAHDFNNMLSVIVSSTEQILARDLPSNVVEETNTIQSAARRARDLTRQLLSFSRGQYLNLSVVDLNSLIERLAPIFRRLIGNSTLELDLGSQLCPVEVDPAQVDQVLTNLVVNAGDAMVRGGVLTIRTRTVIVHDGQDYPRNVQPGTYARIVVSDTGEGMDLATLNHVFEPFFTTKASRSGTGLGLATAYGIITQGGGNISVESKLAHGTSFTILLPAAKQRSNAVPPPAPQRDSKEARTILLVDDEPLVRKATSRLLRSMGYTVLAAESGEVALALANQHLEDIDLVLTDVVMPEMNGLDLARELSRRSPSLKILFMSGFTDGVLAERGVLKPGVLYLQKPIQKDELARCLASAFGQESN
ncbi:MAG TPA: response regulator [Polyangiaceae bacterium]